METVSDESSMYLLVGTYTASESEGIYVYQFDTISGYSKYVDMAKVENPSYLVVSNNEKFVYSVTEVGEDAAANAFSFDKSTGKLELLNSLPTGGADPCYINIGKKDKHIVTANYSGGNVTLLNTKDDGSLNEVLHIFTFTGKGVDPNRQNKPHIHCVQYSPDGKYLYATDLGTDKIHKFDINASPDDYLRIGTPSFIKVADGSGPRHLEFHPNGKYAYLINEISGTVIGFNYNDENGNLTEFQTIQADTLNAQGSGDIHITPNGKYIYASNRLKGDGLAIFSIDQTNGKLTKVGYQETGAHPRNFVITPNGKYLLVASRDNNVIQVFAIDNNTGLLENMYKDIELDMPVCLKFVSYKE
ncbi:MAG: lactonase family protein [Dysgonomonas sp.]|nr:lactonase family protein [Dysgonomonas sp.]